MPDEIQILALETLQMSKQAIVFAPTRASAEKMAEDIAKMTSLQHPDLEQAVLKAASTPTRQCRRLSHCLRKGVAFHHAGLLEKQRTLIEEEFRAGKVKIICATPTLAAGVSLPAFRVIIKSLKRYSGQWGMDWIPVLEYLQMAGRAGRPEYESYGEAIALAKDEAEKNDIYQRYLCGVPEEIYSKLAAEPVLRTYLLSLISSGVIHNQESMIAFFGQTFWAHQFGDLEKLRLMLDKMAMLLQEWGFIHVRREGNEFVPADSLARKEQLLRPTVLGVRVSELYLDPLTAYQLLQRLRNYGDGRTAFSFLHALSHTLEMRPLLRVKMKEQDWIQEELVKRYAELLEPEPSAFNPDYEEFIDAVKTALFFEGWISERDEDYLLENYDIRPGEIRGKIEIADWLLYSCEELSKVTSLQPSVLGALAKLRLRIQYGIREDLLPLIRLKGIGRVRARKLVQQGIRDLGGIKRVNLITLGQILGKAVAEDVKKQVGEDVIEPISETKRKGQMSVTKFSE